MEASALFSHHGSWQVRLLVFVAGDRTGRRKLSHQVLKSEISLAPPSVAAPGAVLGDFIILSVHVWQRQRKPLSSSNPIDFRHYNCARFYRSVALLGSSCGQARQGRGNVSEAFVDLRFRGLLHAEQRGRFPAGYFHSNSSNHFNDTVFPVERTMPGIVCGF